MSAFASWLMGFATTFLSWLYNHIIDLLQGAIDGFATFCIAVVGLFPEGTPVPVSTTAVPDQSMWVQFIHALNWVFPVSYFLECVAFVGAAMIAYFVIAPLARWVKLLN
ncbi:MAG: hypothetical protein FPO08_01090 [Geobacter sp.]|nr:MAG: hypothetical protein FPO08_01090 [Geobacter sp.]